MAQLLGNSDQFQRVTTWCPEESQPLSFTEEIVFSSYTRCHIYTYDVC